jgi:hypothetical protein
MFTEGFEANVGRVPKPAFTLTLLKEPGLQLKELYFSGSMPLAHIHFVGFVSTIT